MRQVRRVDDDVGELTQRCQHAPVGVDRLSDRARLRKRMAPARLAKSADEQLVGSVEEEQPYVVGAADCDRSRCAGRRARASLRRSSAIATSRAAERSERGDGASSTTGGRCSMQ